MRIIIDTNVLFDLGAIAALEEHELPKVVPAIVFLERTRHRWRDAGESPNVLRGVFERLGWRIEPFGNEEAERIVQLVKSDAIWSKHGRDAMIAGHVGPMDQLWTHNARDFLAVGLDARHIVDLSAKGPPALAVHDIRAA